MKQRKKKLTFYSNVGDRVSNALLGSSNYRGKNPYGDFDRDYSLNFLDCSYKNKRKQGILKNIIGNNPISSALKSIAGGGSSTTSTQLSNTAQSTSSGIKVGGVTFGSSGATVTSTSPITGQTSTTTYSGGTSKTSSTGGGSSQTISGTPIISGGQITGIDTGKQSVSIPSRQSNNLGINNFSSYNLNQGNLQLKPKNNNTKRNNFLSITGKIVNNDAVNEAYNRKFKETKQRIIIENNPYYEKYGAAGYYNRSDNTIHIHPNFAKNKNVEAHEVGHGLSNSNVLTSNINYNRSSMGKVDEEYYKKVYARQNITNQYLIDRELKEEHKVASFALWKNMPNFFNTLFPKEGLTFEKDLGVNTSKGIFEWASEKPSNRQSIQKRGGGIRVSEYADAISKFFNDFSFTGNVVNNGKVNQNNSKQNISKNNYNYLPDKNYLKRVNKAVSLNYK